MFSTPKNIDNLNETELADLIYESPNQKIPDKNVRMQICKIIYNALGFDMDNDLMLALASEPKSQLVLATAGSGKTTYSQIKVAIEKIYRKTVNNKPLSGDRVLCLVYNKHNVQPMLDSHSKLVSKLYSSNIQGLKIDMKIKAQTMHSFCSEWSAQYALKMNRVNFQLINETQQKELFNMCYKLVSEKQGVEPKFEKYADLMQLYSYLRETMREYSNCDDLDLFNCLGIPKEVVVETYERFDAFKQVKRLFDFTDTLVSMLKLLREDEEVRSFIQNYYDYIVVDEVQDFNPIFMEILKLIQGPNTPILCIGDEDQSIYGFRGASVLSVLNFENEFPDAKVYSLGTNRRCGENIVDVAKQILSWNTLRFDKTIKGIRPEGKVEYIPYNTEDGQLINLCNRLKNMTKEELSNTCICYRNRKSSLMLSDKLVECGIQFNIISGYKPFSHELYRHVIDVLDILYRPYDREYVKNLYKILPYVRKNEFHNMIGYDARTKQWKGEREKKHFSEYDLGKYETNLVVKKYLALLTEISARIVDMPMTQYMAAIYEMLRKAFWDDKMYMNDTKEIDEAFTEKTFAMFNTKMTYPEFERVYAKHKRIFETNDKQKIGCTLSTFHSLKGLEFDNVFIIDLDDEIFPNFAGIDSTDYFTDDMKLGLKEEETRLFYVAITRARDNLTMFYSSENPSLFVDRLLNGTEEPKSKLLEFGTNQDINIGGELNNSIVLDKEEDKEVKEINEPSIPVVETKVETKVETEAKVEVETKVEVSSEPKNTGIARQLDLSYMGYGNVEEIPVAKEEPNTVIKETILGEIDDDLDDELETVSVNETPVDLNDNLDDELDDELETPVAVQETKPNEIVFNKEITVTKESTTEVNNEVETEEEREVDRKSTSRRAFLNSIINRI